MLSANTLAGLQHTVGNQVVSRMLVQRVLRIGPPGSYTWFTRGDELRDAAFEQVGANAASIENLAAMAEDTRQSTPHAYESWAKAFEQTEHDMPDTLSPAPTRPVSSPRSPEMRTENQTRIGMEIETGSHFRISPKFAKVANGLTNVTLASTPLVEFVLDDLNEKSLFMQGEFRTKPLTQAQLKDVQEIFATIRKSITAFPVGAFGEGKDFETIVATLQKAGWKAEPELEQIATHMKTVEFGKPMIKQIQHVTHSIPLAGFVALPSNVKGLLLPRSESVSSIRQLLVFFFGKIQAVTRGGTIAVTTTGRNGITPNVKTALDTIIALLPPSEADATIDELEKLGMPKAVQLGKEVKPIEPLRPRQPLEHFPRFNMEQDRAHVSAEEKLHPPMMDTSTGDIRVLIEHRSDALVDALNAAAAGKSKLLEPYMKAFAALDVVGADTTMFKRWFTPGVESSDQSE